MLRLAPFVIVLLVYVFSVFIVRKLVTNLNLFIFCIGWFNVFGWFVGNIVYNSYPYTTTLFGYDIYNILLNLNILLYFFHYVCNMDAVNSTYFYEYMPLSKYHFNTFYSPIFFVFLNILYIFFFMILSLVFSFMGRIVTKIRKENGER